MDSLYPYDFSAVRTYIESASYWCHEGKHGEHRPSHDQQHDDDSSQPCDPGDEEPDDSDDDGGGSSGGSGSTDGTLDPPENSGELGGDEDTSNW